MSTDSTLQLPSFVQRPLQFLVDGKWRDATSGERTIKVPAEKLVPAGATAPLSIEDFVFTPDEQRLLIFTNSARVWRSNTRGDYWVVDLSNWSLRKLGGNDAKPSTLMFEVLAGWDTSWLRP